MMWPRIFNFCVAISLVLFSFVHPASAQRPNRMADRMEALQQQTQQQKQQTRMTGQQSGTRHPAPNEAPETDWQDVEKADVQTTHLSQPDIARISDKRFNWKHAATPHFYVHYEKNIFARKVARMGEQFYQHISADLPGLPDRVSPSRSHIFIIRDPKDWKIIRDENPDLSENVISFVQGHVMYLQQFGDSKAEQMSLLAHEMTHLVVNRFLTVRIPRWLNEGMAKYYQEFAYAATRGMGKSKRATFTPFKQPMPLATTLNIVQYPVDIHENLRFYKTSKYLIGFLVLDRSPQGQWQRFLTRVQAGESVQNALLDTFGFQNVAELEAAFLKFAR